jgi:hypothetical protein
MCSKSYWGKRKRKRSNRGQHGADCRWRKYHEKLAGEPVRTDRVIEITIRDSHRPMTVIRLRREQNDEGRWGRWRGIGKTALGPSGVGKLIGKYLE